MSDMEGFLGKQIADAYEKDHRLDAQLNRALRENLGAQTGLVQQLRASKIQLEAEVAKLKRRNKELEQAAQRQAKSDDAANLQAELDRLGFERAKWVVSQKAFKELAMRFGAEQGLDADAVIEKGNALKIGVVMNAFDAGHGTNANGLPDLARELDMVKAELVTDQTFARDFQAHVSEGVLYQIDASIPASWQAAFDGWLKLANSGHAEASYNVGWCYLNGKVAMFGDDFLTPHRWLSSALAQGEPRSARSLYWLHVRNPFHKHQRNEVVDECLAFGLRRQDAWAIEVERERDAEAESERQRKALRELEEADYKSVCRVVVGKNGVKHELDRLQGKDYPWLHDLRRFVGCSTWLQYDAVRKSGGMFSSARQGDLWFYIENTSDAYLRVAAHHQQRVPRGSLAFTEIAPGQTSRFILGQAVPVTNNPLVDPHGGQPASISVFLKSGTASREYAVHLGGDMLVSER